MENDKETKKRLIKSAKTEFIEKGYQKASLRTICKNAGVTTGALYFFFNNKEDLFASIVDEPYKYLKKMLLEHFSEHDDIFDKSTSINEALNTKSIDHHDFIELLVHHLFVNRDYFLLILAKSQGTSYEGCVDEIVEITEKAILHISERTLEYVKGKTVSIYMCHLITHMIVDTVVHLITHKTDEREALVYVSKVLEMFLDNWINLVLIDNE